MAKGQKQALDEVRDQLSTLEGATAAAEPFLAHWMSRTGQSELEQYSAGLLEAIETTARETVFYNLKTIYEFAESPIERMLLASLALGFAGCDPLGAFFRGPDKDVEATMRRQQAVQAGPGSLHAWNLVLQAGFPGINDGRSFRVDLFCFIHGRPSQALVVECDGYEYHGGRDQFAADRKRDRLLSSRGHRVVRYSGSEIHADPVLASIDLYDVLVEMRSK